MTQYLDNEGASYIAQKIQDIVQVVIEDSFDINTADRMSVYCAVERLPKFEYMNLIALTDGDITITIPANVNSTYATSISYSKDKTNWTDTAVDSTDQTITIPVAAGDRVYLKGVAKQWMFNTARTNIGSTANINASGNVMSLLYDDDFEDKTSFPADSMHNLQALFRDNTHLIDAGQLELPATTLANNCYDSMFYGCTSLTTAPALPATTLASSCYSQMFYDCTSLTTAPALPATTLTNYCYYYMFNGCTSLTTAPALPATTLANNCYNVMFYGCTSLTTAPALPATTLASSCYYNMFSGCTSLTTAPELPATTLASSCYRQMFQNCTSLTTAPELPATTLAIRCYASMFNGCTSLNNIIMLATDISAQYCLNSWVGGVASSGTFTKATAMTEETLTRGVNGIPDGWTVVDAALDL